jgi:acetyl-CoA C-acetyltransferase
MNIIGTGSTKFSEHWNRGIKELIQETVNGALKSSGLNIKDIDSLYVANCFGNTINGQGNINAICSSMFGINNSIAIGGGDSSGSQAIIQAANSIAAGNSRIALVIGVEKMSDLGMNDSISVISQVLDYDYEAAQGATLAGLYALIASRHMKMHKTSLKQLDLVSVKNHTNAANNDMAQFKFAVTKEDVAKSPMVASPLRVLHSAATGDGCCAVIMANDEIAKSHKGRIKLIGDGTGSDFLAVHEREDITTFNALKQASRIAFEKAKIKPHEISFAELHDAFSISELISIEDIGFVKKGEGGKFIEQGGAAIDGIIPINPSGGLKGCGHPFAATGIRQAIESYIQLNGNGGKRQVKNTKYALTSTISGTGSGAVVLIFSR